MIHTVKGFGIVNKAEIDGSYPTPEVRGGSLGELSKYINKYYNRVRSNLGFPGGSDGKVSACTAGDPGSFPGLGRSPGEGNGNLLQYSCLGNHMDRVWWAAAHEVARVN